MALEYALGNGALGVDMPPHYECPEAAVSCNYPPYTTLALCGAFQDRTGELTNNCTTNIDSETTCTYDWSSRRNGTRPFEARFYKIASDDRTERSYDVYKQVFERGGNYSAGLRMLALRTKGAKFGNTTVSIQGAQLFDSRWYWCTQTYTNTTATAATLKPGSMTSEELAEGLKVIGTHKKFVATSTGREYRVALNTENYIWQNLQEHLRASVSFIAGYDLGALDPSEESAHTLQSDGGSSSSFALLLYSADPAELTERIAKTITSHIRSAATGDNQNGTTVPGQAVVSQTFIHVRWQWLMLPLIETVLAAILLVVTIVTTNRPGLPLLKTSNIGLLFHGLEGWVAGETSSFMEGKETAEKLETAAQSMVVRLARDDDERLRFVQV